MILVWIITAILCNSIAILILSADFPVFIYINLIIALIVISRTDNLQQYFLHFTWRIDLLRYATVNLLGILVIYLMVEPWTGLYGRLLELSLDDGVDVTFGWIDIYGNYGFFMMLIFSGFVSIFAEELMFRGILLGYLTTRFPTTQAVIIQALIFTIPQSVILFVFPLVDGILFLVCYSVLAIGVINGYITERSQSIFPSVIAATLANFLMSLIYFI